MFAKATEADFPLLAAFEADWSSEAWSEEAFRAFSREGSSTVLVLRENEELVGYAAFRLVCDYGELETCFIAPAFRRRGYAKMLLSEVLRCAAEAGACLTLEVRESNLAARRLYESLGFVPCGKRRTFYRAPTEDAVVYTHSGKEA